MDLAYLAPSPGRDPGRPAGPGRRAIQSCYPATPFFAALDYETRRGGGRS